MNLKDSYVPKYFCALCVKCELSPPCLYPEFCCFFFCHCWLFVLFIVSLDLTLACLASLGYLCPTSLHRIADDACELKIVINAWATAHEHTGKCRKNTHTHTRRMQTMQGNFSSEGCSISSQGF